jgi:hypothetical protein
MIRLAGLVIYGMFMVMLVLFTAFFTSPAQKKRHH